MAIVEVRIDGSAEERTKPEKPEKPETLKSGVIDEDSEQALNNETEEFLKEAKRRVSALSRAEVGSFHFNVLKLIKPHPVINQ